jgi:predicted O-methyltransferase YrrM
MKEIINNLLNNQTIQAIKKTGIDLQIPMIEDEGLAFIVSLLSNKKNAKILEIGTAIGYSAIAISILSEAQIWSIERNADLFSLAKKHVNEVGLSDRIHLIYGDAFDTNVENIQFDLIFIDAAKAQYKRFFERFESYLTQDGMIITDNLSFHGIVNHEKESLTRNQRALARKIQGFIDWLRTNDKFQTEFFNIGDGMSVSFRK